ncbi:ankyrin repeat-containing domain protein [Hypoxylon trugodes]|uniref:ankyrin repeat-containing domain protein n=1 Tax=Hypoxylon trugodes TaxID=326681 RepID=UPI00218C93A7|nr:ankyrin repeat-containing domain protein [Hypoxylon trugodes]KAI1384071.1 ankyrin repeat-containing domain protein [Hypoxylon trugodes]
MSFPGGPRTHSNVKAENLGTGAQCISGGSGDQNVASGSGTVNKYGHQFNMLSFRDIPEGGIPSMLRLSQSQFVAKPGSIPEGPNRAEIISWLMRQPDQTPLKVRRHHTKILRQVVHGTGKWVLDTEQLMAWKDSSSSSRFLWLRGMLGSGKTMLMLVAEVSSLIIDSIEKQIERGEDIACVYFYFQEGEEYSVARIWATLLEQLLQASGDLEGALEGELKAKFDDSLQGSFGLDSSEYLELFKAQAGTIKTVYLVIDALDSCEGDTQQKMQGTLKVLPQNIRVLITSRNDLVGLEGEANQKLSIKLVQQDVETYLKQRIEDSEFLKVTLKKEQDRNHVISRVTDMTLSSKMFLSARLHMDNLSKLGTLGDIEQALDHLPDSAFDILHATAAQIAQKIKKRGNDFESCLTKHILTWIMHAKTKLTADQIRDGFAIQKSGRKSYEEHRPAKELLMPACNGLVIMDPDKETFTLVHKSVEDSFRGHKVIPENADLEIAKTCLSCLLVNTHGQEDEPALLQYAAKYWWAHLCRQEADPEAESLTLEFLKDSSKLARAFRAIERAKNDAFDNMTGFHAAVHFGLLDWAVRLLKEGIDINTQCSDGQTALHWAVRYGRCALLDLFINNSADPNIRDHDKDTPLHKALMGPAADRVPLYRAITKSAANDATIVEALIRGGAKLDIRNAEGLSPMSSAIRYGPTSLAKIMAESQDDVNAEIFEDWSSLRQVFYHGQNITGSGVANQKGHRDRLGGWAQLQHAFRNHALCLIDVLLERGVDLNRRTKDGWTPLTHAAKYDDLSSLNRLLTRQPNPADVNLRDGDEKSPLWWAVYWKNISAIQLLAEHGADVDGVCMNESTPLLEAVTEQYDDIVQLLIRLNADVNKEVGNGSTLLIEATKLQSHSIACALLNAGADPDKRDSTNKSALLYAIEKRDRALAWLLVVKTGPIAIPNKNIQDALELVISRDDPSMAWLLCEHGASPSATSDKSITFLHQAARRGKYKTAQFLIEHGVDIDTMDATGSTPLHYAVLNRKNDITNLLASRLSRLSGAQSLDICNADGDTALILATLKRRHAAMQTLLQYGASCNFADPGGMTALHNAASRGFNQEVDLLLNEKFGGNPNIVDNDCFTPLHHAINGGNADMEVVRALMRAGANIEAQDKDGRTPLMLATQLGHEELVRGLLEEGADAQARNKHGWTAAWYVGDTPDIQKLLDELQPPPTLRY